MASSEKDPVTGKTTTGHEWDGLKELNTPLPKWWFWTFVATVIWGIGYAILYPSVPGITGYFRGVLGYSQRANVTADVQALQARRAEMMAKLNKTPLADVKKDEALYAVAMTAGRLTFAENCRACHGAGGEGRPGFPSIASDAWIWGGKLDDIQRTITYGIRSGHPEARVSQMPRFGVDGMLKPAEIDAVVKQYNAFYEIQHSESAMGYMVDHTSRIYLVDPAGKVRYLFRSTDSPEQIAAGIRAVLQEAS